MGKAFESIRQGPNEAAAHAQGETAGVKVYELRTAVRKRVCSAVNRRF